MRGFGGKSKTKMIYYVYNIKTGNCDYSGTIKECREYIELHDSQYLEIRGGH